MMYYRVSGQHFIRVDWNGTEAHVDKPVAAEKTRRVNQSTEFHCYQYRHYDL